MEELEVLKLQLQAFDGSGGVGNDFGIISMIEAQIGILDNAGEPHDSPEYKALVEELEKAKIERDKIKRRIDKLEAELQEQENEEDQEQNEAENENNSNSDEPKPIEQVEIDAVEKEKIRKRIAEYEALNQDNEGYQKGQDVLPVLQELEGLEEIPNTDIKAIYANELLDRIERYKKQLQNLENMPGLQKNSAAANELIAQIEEINEKLAQIKEKVTENPNFDAESIERTKLEVAKYNLQNKLREQLKKDKGRNSQDIINEIEEINRKLAEIEEEVAKHPNFDAESIERQKLNVAKFNLQKELKEALEKEKDQEQGKDNSREKERLKNIIAELESLYNERIKIKVPKEKENSEIENGDNPPEEQSQTPPQEPPTQTEPPANKKVPKHWVEIMAETQTQSTGSIMQYFHNMGKIQPFRMGLTLWAAPIKLGMKGVGKLVGDGIGRVSGKQNEMVEKIRNLPPEEFETLVNGLTETNVRQYKVNENYLEAVLVVLRERENAKKQESIEKDNTIREALNQIRKDKEGTLQELQNPALTPEREVDLKIQLERQNMTEAMLKAQHITEYDKQVRADLRVTDLERAKTGKSTSKMNIQGWFLGKFNPDNRELHKQMAELYKQRREAEEAGDLSSVNEANMKLEEMKLDNTKEMKFLQSTRFASRARINRGLHTVEEVHRKPSDAAQNKGRELIATIMAGVTFADLVRHSGMKGSQQDQINQQIEQHNAQIRSANDNNRSVKNEIDTANSANAQVSDNINAARSTITENDLANAAASEIHRNNAFSYATRHEREFLNDNTPGVGFNHGGSDDAIHAAQESMTSAREAAQASGDVNTLVQHAQDTYNNARQAASDVLPDVSNFTSISGKAAFTNSEYVTNLQNIVSSSTDSLTLMKQLFDATNKIGDVSQITGTIQSVSEMSPVILETSTATAMNILPFVTSMANLVDLEAKKAQLQEQRRNDKQKTKTKDKDKNKPEKENGNER